MMRFLVGVLAIAMFCAVPLWAGEEAKAKKVEAESPPKTLAQIKDVQTAEELLFGKDSRYKFVLFYEGSKLKTDQLLRDGLAEFAAEQENYKVTNGQGKTKFVVLFVGCDIEQPFCAKMWKVLQEKSQKWKMPPIGGLYAALDSGAMDWGEGPAPFPYHTSPLLQAFLRGRFGIEPYKPVATTAATRPAPAVPPAQGSNGNSGTRTGGGGGQQN